MLGEYYSLVMLIGPNETTESRFGHNEMIESKFCSFSLERMQLPVHYMEYCGQEER